LATVIAVWPSASSARRIAATTLDNKHAFKREAICAGLPTAPFCVWHPARGRFRPDLNSRFERQFCDYDGPFIVKPVSGRASLHVHVIPDRASLSDAIDDVYRNTANLVLIEKYLEGREFCIAVCGTTIAQGGTINRLDEPFAFGALERLFNDNELIFTSMDVKPITYTPSREVHRQMCSGGMTERVRPSLWDRHAGTKRLIRIWGWCPAHAALKRLRTGERIHVREHPKLAPTKRLS
jgi:D-Ala-D-Ala ligase-like protein